MPVWERLTGKRFFSVWLNEGLAERGSVRFGGIDERKFDGELEGEFDRLFLQSGA